MQNNPLLIDIPLLLTLECLPFKDIKKCRMVCQQWNRNASLILRDRTKITFRPQSRLPKTFLKKCQNSQPSLFKSFVLKCQRISKQFEISELDYFFEKWGANIQCLDLRTISLYIGMTDVDRLYYDITPWLDLSPKIKELKINCCKLEMCLESLRPIPRLALNGSVVKLIVDDFNEKRLTPEEISWNSGVIFKKDGADMKNVILNDFLDFGKAKKITVKNQIEKFNTKFDLSADIFDARCLVLEDDYLSLLTKRNYQSGFINWKKCRGKVDFLLLHGMKYLEANNLQMKQLLLYGCCEINLSAIPKSVEKIEIGRPCTISCSRSPIRLPNLTYLCLSVRVTISHPDCVSHFKDCDKLLDLEFYTDDFTRDEILNLKLQSIPKSVKRLKVSGKINIEDDTAFDVDVLILKDVHSDIIENIIAKINTKFLVLSLTKTLEEIPYRKLYQFIDRNDQLEKIAVGIHSRKFYFLYTLASAISIQQNEFKKMEKLDHLDETYRTGFEKCE